MLNNFGCYILYNIYLLRQYMCVYYNSIFLRIILCLVLIISVYYYDMFVFSSQNAYVDTRHTTFYSWGQTIIIL